jgi:hypothetical protein
VNSLIGKWQQPAGQPYPGLWFEFHEDGTFASDFSEMGITSSGTYSLNGERISMDQTQHTLGWVGKFEGRFTIDGKILKMAVGNLGEDAPGDLSNARTYLKI